MECDLDSIAFYVFMYVHVFSSKPFDNTYTCRPTYSIYAT